MDSSGAPAASVFRFGVFELDCQAGELRKSGRLIHLPPQPFKILALLASHPGQVVTREDIRGEIWGDETFVDFEQGLNHCIRQIRTALGDDAETPRYIKTLPRRGYRFIAPLDGGSTSPPTHQREVPDRRYRTVWMAATSSALIVAILALLFAFNVARLRNRLLGWATGAPEIHSIAVLPLANLSGDPRQEYFADGMTEELITTLGKISALRVISRTSVMRYKGTKKPLPEIARELHVDAVVEGTMQRSGNRVRITANLLYGPADRHLWSETYERDLGDVLALQSNVAQAIANEIKAKVTIQEQTRLAHTRPVNPKAHEAYLKGRFFFHNLSKQNVLKAIKYGQQAVGIDPDYAAAYGLLASAYWESGVHAWGDLPDQEEAARTRAAATKALEIDESLPEGHVGLGIVLDTHDWKWAAADQEFRRAIELNPNFARAHAMYAWHLLFVGRWDQSIQEAKRAVELDPFSSHVLMTRTAIHYFARHYDQALECARRWLEIFPDSPGVYEHMWFVYQPMGKYDEAIAARQKAMTLRGRSPKDIEAFRRAYQVGGIRGVWRWKLEDLKKRGASATGPHAVALFYALLGEKDKAIEWLERGYRQRDHAMVFIKTNYEFDPLRSDPRFQDLLRRMNFPP